jgi:hypothetical protein
VTTYSLGDVVTLTFTAPADATVVLNVAAPDGTESTPAVSHVLTAWSATVTANQYDTWLFAWIATGTGSNVQLGQFDVGAPLYAPLDILKLNLNIAPADTTLDVALRQKLDSASRSVEQYCDDRQFYLDTAATVRTYAVADRSVICRRDGTERISVDDIGSLTDLAVEVGDGTTWTTLAASAYETFPDNAVARRRAIAELVKISGTWTANRRLRVTARWGWPTVPTAVYEATLLQAMRLFRRKDSPEGVAGSADWGLVRVPNLDPDVKALLAYLSNQFQAA